MRNVRWFNETRPYAPAESKAKSSGARPSVKKILDLVDMDEPAWPTIAEVLKEMTAAGVELDARSVDTAVKMGRLQHAKAKIEPPVIAVPFPLRLWPEQDGCESIVYYIKRGKLIKIGTTIHPEKRFGSLVPDAILAWEPGGYAEEELRHAQFKHLRRGEGEYFERGADLVKHCKAVKKVHGEPPLTWSTTENIGRRRASALPEPPDPVSKETATASDAAVQLGISRNTVHGWAHRGRIKPAGRNERGAAMYYIEQVQFLAGHSKGRS